VIMSRVMTVAASTDMFVSPRLLAGKRHRGKG
jgi:hypothetical protein